MTDPTPQAVRTARDLGAALRSLTQSAEHSPETIEAFIGRFARRERSLGHLRDQDHQDCLAQANPLRNLRITQSYHDLTLGMGQVLGTESISWVGVATWASRTAGFFIRNEEIPALLWRGINQYYQRASWREQLVGTVLDLLGAEHTLEALLARFFIDAVNHVSQQIGEGNTKVYQELAPLFTRAIREFSADDSYRQETIDRFCADLVQGPTVEEGDTGQDLLKTAFRAYYHARFEQDPHAKAQWILLANAATGLHEQIRLQPAIFSSLNAPFEVVGELRQYISRETKQAVPVQLHMLVDLILWLLAPLLERADDLWLHLATELLMTLQLPGRTLRLGRDLQTWGGGRSYPRALERIDNPQLRAILEQYDENPDSLEGSGTQRWDHLPDRMNYILELFRIHQQDATLYQAPFTDAQTPLLYQNQVPQGPL